MKIFCTRVHGPLEVVHVVPPRAGELDLRVSPSGEETIYDGIWLNGERCFDTVVVVDGWVEYRTPPRRDACDQSFDRHEAHGGGRTLV